MRPRLHTQMRPRLQTHKITTSNESTSTGWQVRVITSYPFWHRALMLPGPFSPAGPLVATQDALQACSVLSSCSLCSHRPLCEMTSLCLRGQSRYLGTKHHISFYCLIKHAEGGLTFATSIPLLVMSAVPHVSVVVS